MEKELVISAGKGSRIVYRDDIAALAPVVETARRVYLVYDTAVRQHVEMLKEQCGNIVADYPLNNVCEKMKTFGTVQKICRWLMSEGAERNDSLLAVGGGIVTDLVGFAGSVYMRGMSVIYLPTTLLAQVDAAIGGKTGVNIDSYKNMAGTFSQPKYVLICPQVLDSLPEKTFNDGLAEMLKTFIIDSGEIKPFKKLPFGGDEAGDEAQEDAPGQRKPAEEGMTDAFSRMLEAVACMQDNAMGLMLAAKEKKEKFESRNIYVLAPENVRVLFNELIFEAAAIKAAIVQRDEREGGERRKLNLGHTFAHAIEYCARTALRKKNISHGEAVGMGLLLAAKLSVAMDFCDFGVFTQILIGLTMCDLPTDCPIKLSDLEMAMRHDKKSDSGKVRFILIHDIGEVSETKLDVAQAIEMIEKLKL